MNLIDTIKKFNKILDPRQKRNFWIIVLITLIGAFFEMLGVSLMVPLITAIINPSIITTNKFAVLVCNSFGLSTHQQFVIACIVGLIVLYLVKNIFLVFSNYAQARYVFNNRFATKKELLHVFLARPYEYYLNSSSSEILRTINEDVENTYNLLMTTIQFMAESLVSLALLVTVFVIDAQMTIVIAGLLAIILFVINKVIKPILEKKGEENRYYSRQGYKWIVQSVQGIKEIKISNKESYFEKNFEVAGRKQTNAMKWLNVFNNAPRNLIELGCVCATLGVIAIMIVNGKPLDELIPALGAFALAAVRLMPAANRMVNMFNYISYTAPSIDAMMEHKTFEKSFEQRTSGGEIVEIKDKIELKNITYKYPNSPSFVLDNASMEIPVNHSVGIIGKSGAGKTTAVDVMLGLLTAQSGEILADGVNVMDNYASWLSHIGYIPQSIFMLEDSIKANVSFGNDEDDDRVWATLKDAQMDEFVRSLPDGINTDIGERGIRLSGGQRQRIGIARALYNNPDILVFDEATSSLDNETEQAIMESINGLHGKKTMVIIAHRLQTIENCDIVYRVHKGKIEKESNY